MEQLKTVAGEKENYESEAESLRRRYDRLLSENEDLIGELQIRERSGMCLRKLEIFKGVKISRCCPMHAFHVTFLLAEIQIPCVSESQLLNDIKKLHENNESVKILCTNVTQEKIHLEEELGKLSNRVDELTAERNLWNQTLCPKLGINRLELKDLVSLVDGMSSPRYSETGKSEDGRIEELSQMLLASQKDHDALQQEMALLKDKNQRLMSELDTANVDRDQMMTNLEGVRVETKTLIENVEKLTEEIDVIKLEKQKSEGTLNKVIESKNEEIDGLLKDLSKNKTYVNELLASLELHMVNKPGESKAKHNIDRNVLVILKEGIVSNLTDLADTMPEYSREFLNKLDAILEGADCQGEVGADIFVHYFNECLSQLKISLKENEILSKEVDHLKNSIKELENSVSNHNKDCEILRGELEELSSDSSRLLLDLSNLRHENSIRVTEIGELMVRLKQRDDQFDQLKEANYQIEMKYSASINELTTQLADANNNTVQLQEQNQQLESRAMEYQTLLNDIQSGSSKEVSAMQEELASAKEAIASLQKDLEESQNSLDAKVKEIEKDLDQTETLKQNCQSLSATNESLRMQLDEVTSKLNQRSLELEDAKQLLAERSKEKLEVLESSEKMNEKIESLNKSLGELHEAFNAQSLELTHAREGVNQNENLMKELENSKAILNAKSSALEDAERHLRDSAEVSTELELMKKKLEEKSLELEKSRKQIEELAIVTAELENMKAMNQKVMTDLQTAFDLAREKEFQHREEVKKMKAVGLQSRLNQNQVSQKEIQDLGAALKHQGVELEKAQKVLLGKEVIEDELSQLKVIQQKTMEELENTKKRLDESKSARKNSTELEKAMRAKSAELEKALFNLDEHKAAEMSVSEELEKVQFELKAKSEELEVIKRLADERQTAKSAEIAILEELEKVKIELKAKSEELEVTKRLAADERQSAKSVADRLAEELQRALADSNAAQKDLQEKSKMSEELNRLNECLATLKDSESAKNAEMERLSAKVEDLEKNLADKGRALTAADKKLEENEAVKSEILAEREVLIMKIEELQKSQSLLMESEGIAAGLKEQLEKLQKELSDSEKLTEVNSSEKLKALQDLQRLSDEVQCLQCENKVLSDKLAEQGRIAVDEFKKKNGEMKKLLKELEESKEMVNFKKMELEDINCIWAGRLNSLKVNLSSLGRCLHDLGRQSRELQHMFVERVRTLQNVITVSVTCMWPFRDARFYSGAHPRPVMPYQRLL